MIKKNVPLFLNRSICILKFFGLWLPPKNHEIIYTIYLIFVMLTQYCFVFFDFVYIFYVWGDLDEVSEASYLLFTQASVCYKTTAFLFNKRSLIFLLEFMECDIFVPRCKVHETFLSMQARKIKRLCMFFLTSALTTCTLWAMIPLLDDGGTRSFPFKIWMPVDPQKSPEYEFGYVYQMVAIYTSGFLFIAVDSVALSLIMFGCAQIKIIMEKLKTIQGVSISPKLKYEERIKMMNENYKLYVDCVRHHQAVVSFIEIVENTYHVNIFFQLSGTVAIVCIIGLRISIAEKGSIQFYSMVNYMVTMLSQLFIYCWCGDELTTLSEELRERLYQCQWYEQDNRFRRALWITMERMKKLIIFKAGHYIPLSRPTFVSILRLSYSYFAVLNQTHNK